MNSLFKKSSKIQLRFSLLWVTFFGSYTAFAQLYCGSGGYLYANDALVFVQQDINLASGGNVYLRNQSQVIQGEKTNSTNSGTGTLSVFQEGTSDAYDYNFWCSPVGAPAASAGNSSFGITLLNRPQNLTTSTPAIILPPGENEGIANPLSIAPYWIWKFVNGTEYSDWIYVGESTTINAGEGFSMKGTLGTDNTQADNDGIVNNPGGTGAQRYDFRGKPNDGRIAVPVLDDNFTLTGNPYPSALHLNAFLLDAENSACTGIAYFWEQDKTVNTHILSNYVGGYGTYAPISLLSSGIYVAATYNTYFGDGSLNTIGLSSNLSIGRKFSPIGQGFFINGAANGSVFLKNSHRAFYKETQPLSGFERPNRRVTATTFETIPEVAIMPPSHFVMNIRMNNNQHVQQLAYVAEESATDGIDRGIDAESPTSFDLPYEAAFVIEDKRFVITGSAFDLAKRIPIIVKANSTVNFSFELKETIAFDNQQPIYIFDSLTNTYNDIRFEPYTTTVEAGTISNRFELTFSNIPLTVENPTVPSKLEIVTEKSNELIRIKMPKDLLADSAQLFDIAGRLVYKLDTINDSSFTIGTSQISDAVYILKVYSGAKELSEKILVQKK